jgi:hypothetical protein
MPGEKKAISNHLIPLARRLSKEIQSTRAADVLRKRTSKTGTDKHVYQYRQWGKKLIEPASKAGLHRNGFAKKMPPGATAKAT